jgi:integrase
MLVCAKFHDLRHTAATRISDNGASIIAVIEILGHADNKTTMKYFHPAKSLIAAAEILARSFSKPNQDSNHETHY